MSSEFETIILKGLKDDDAKDNFAMFEGYKNDPRVAMKISEKADSSKPDLIAILATSWREKIHSNLPNLRVEFDEKNYSINFNLMDREENNWVRTITSGYFETEEGRFPVLIFNEDQPTWTYEELSVIKEFISYFDDLVV